MSARRTLIATPVVRLRHHLTTRTHPDLLPGDSLPASMLLGAALAHSTTIIHPIGFIARSQCSQEPRKLFLKRAYRGLNCKPKFTKGLRHISSAALCILHTKVESPVLLAHCLRWNFNLANNSNQCGNDLNGSVFVHMLPGLQSSRTRTQVMPAKILDPIRASGTLG
ncbi:hypothetical protein B0H66DRAFT_70762 [Apodospora peruviana]|uniref:Uncharacterized protein n=1 Tax=Apodospora peruviana TaxID=516989 RepID=A0AAE0MGA6_9PEZI|nr:hypothetical protein B0H66DRAFT_70762 [Apodospora peruviana]